MANIPDPLTVRQVNAQKINANELVVTSVGGAGGGGSEITASKITLTSGGGSWILTAKSDGLYVSTPDGIETKIELIDFRQVPIPPTPDLLNVVGASPTLLPVPGGPNIDNT